jgi:hypothetical protein
MATIILSTSKKDAEITMQGTGRVNINWGDKSEFFALSMDNVIQCIHNYGSNSNLPRTITITGDSIITLGCSENELTSLKFNECSSLLRLSCYINQLTTLDVSGCKALETLACPHNQLNSLNISGCSKLVTLSCHHNQLKDLPLKTTVRTVSSVLTKSISHTDPDYIPYIPYEKFKRFIEFEPRLNVDDMRVVGNFLPIPNPRANQGNFPFLQSLYCNENMLTTLDVSGCAALEHLNCDNNQLKNLTLNGLQWLEFVSCHHNNLTEVNVNGCCSLEKLHCLSGQTTPLNITGLTKENSPLMLYAMQ